MKNALRYIGISILAFIFTGTIFINAQSIDNPTVDMEVVEKIVEEGIENSQLMNMASYLTDVIGPRLTNSAGMYRANEWTAEKLESFGLDVHYHEWGPFGRGWELKRFSMHAQSEYGYFPVTGFPKAWSVGYDGPVSGEVVYLRLDENHTLDDYRGKLEGKFVLIQQPAEAEPSWNPIATRNTTERLLQLANATQQPTSGGPGGTPSAAVLARQQDAYERAQFLIEEQPLAIIDQSYRGFGGQIAISGATLPSEPGTPWAERPRPHDMDAPQSIPQISLTREHYGRIFRMLEHGVDVTLEMDLQVEFQEDNLMAWNTIGEIKGSDPDLADEVVIIGAHLDSWHAATGATDNAAGSVVMMEAMRILSTIGVQPRRTIRIALWSGEEQGLHGSREYVSDHYGTIEGSQYQSTIVRATEDYNKISAYYNVDNGSGQIRGIFLQQNEALRELFRTWLTPFSDWDASTVTWANTGSTDHVSFDRVGIPGFQFIQDPLEYFTLSHHSNMDTYERLVEQDLVRNAVIVATFAYHTAMLDEILPRKDGFTIVTD